MNQMGEYLRREYYYYYCCCCFCYLLRWIEVECYYCSKRKEEENQPEIVAVVVVVAVVAVAVVVVVAVVAVVGFVAEFVEHNFSTMMLK